MMSHLVRYGHDVSPRISNVIETVVIFARRNSHGARKSWSTHCCLVGDSSITRHWISRNVMHGIVRDVVFSRIMHPPLVDVVQATIIAHVPDFIWLGRRERYLLPEDDLELRRGQLQENQVYHIEHHDCVRLQCAQRVITRRSGVNCKELFLCLARSPHSSMVCRPCASHVHVHTVQVIDDDHLHLGVFDDRVFRVQPATCDGRERWILTCDVSQVIDKGKLIAIVASGRDDVINIHLGFLVVAVDSGGCDVVSVVIRPRGMERDAMPVNQDVPAHAFT